MIGHAGGKSTKFVVGTNLVKRSAYRHAAAQQAFVAIHEHCRQPRLPLISFGSK
jgi:hypothetical protein